MTRRDILEAAHTHHIVGQSDLATFSMLILIERAAVRIARALERGNEIRQGGGVVGSAPSKSGVQVAAPGPDATPAHSPLADTAAT